MSDKKAPTPSRPGPRPICEGYRPTETHGYQPSAAKPSGTVQNGHQPTTSQAPTGSPPNQGSGGQSGKK